MQMKLAWTQNHREWWNWQETGPGEEHSCHATLDHDDFCFLKRFIHLYERQSYREPEKEILHLLVQPPSSLNSWD